MKIEAPRPLFALMLRKIPVWKFQGAESRFRSAGGSGVKMIKKPEKADSKTGLGKCRRRRDLFKNVPEK